MRGFGRRRTDNERAYPRANPIAGPDPLWTTCPNCDEEILTRTQKSIGAFQCLAVGGLCLFGLFCPCLFCCFYTPLCVGDWKDVLHTCPNCNHVIGKYTKL